MAISIYGPLSYKGAQDMQLAFHSLLEPGADRLRPSLPAPTVSRGRDLSEALLLVVDTETTGVDVTKDRVVELGAAYFQGGQPGETRRMRLNPGCAIPPEASAIHGIYDDHVRDKPSFADVAPRFLGHVRGGPSGAEPPCLVGYNARGFDVPLLNAELARAGFSERIPVEPVLDLMIFVRWHHRSLRSRSLENICAHYGIPVTRAHSALADALATGQLLLRLLADGLLPSDIDEALRLQAVLEAELLEERATWSYWLYRDRRDRQLRLGAGRHCGALLSEVDDGYLASLLAKIPDLPDPVRAIFSERTNHSALLAG